MNTLEIASLIKRFLDNKAGMYNAMIFPHPLNTVLFFGMVRCAMRAIGKEDKYAELKRECSEYVRCLINNAEPADIEKTIIKLLED